MRPTPTAGDWTPPDPLPYLHLPPRTPSVPVRAASVSYSCVPGRPGCAPVPLRPQLPALPTRPTAVAASSPSPSESHEGTAAHKHKASDSSSSSSPRSGSSSSHSSSDSSSDSTGYSGSSSEDSGSGGGQETSGSSNSQGATQPDLSGLVNASSTGLNSNAPACASSANGCGGYYQSVPSVRPGASVSELLEPSIVANGNINQSEVAPSCYSSSDGCG